MTRSTHHIIAIVASLFASALLVSSAGAAYVWQGGSGSWTSGNWGVGASFPNGPTDDATIGSGNSIISSAIVADDVVINGGGKVTLSGHQIFKVNTLSIDTLSGSQLNLGESCMIIDYPAGGPNPAANVDSLLSSGYNFGGWDGPGIMSSVVVGNTWSVGMVDNQYFHYTSFDGVPIDDSSILLAPCLPGDANLDGFTNLVDYARIQATLSNNPPPPIFWYDGDFNYDDVVNGDDFFIIESEMPLNRVGPTCVPEPAMGLSGGVMFLLASRRRRSSR